jgi:hypothetical protein
MGGEMTNNVEVQAADSDLVEIFEQEVAIILEALGHPEAFVTDESQIGDFLILVFVEPKTEEQLMDMEKINTLNNLTLAHVQSIFSPICEVSRSTHIGELAQKLSFYNASKVRTLH